MTRISEQKVANQMQSVAPDTKYSLQEIIRQHRSELPGTSLQDMLANAVSGDPRMGVQERIFENLKTSLSLTDPYTKYSIQEMLELASANALTLDDVLGVASPSASYYASITVDATKVSDADTADFSNFPLLFSGTFDGTDGEPDFRTVANGGKIQETTTGGNSGGITIPADLAFYDDASKTTQYDHEIEFYDASTGEIVAWVKIPTLDYNDDTVFYVHYGDGTATNQENIAGVWSANYQGVWHLNNSPDGTVYDSTTNANHLASAGSMASGDLVAGQVGKGIQFESASSQYLSIADASQTGLDLATDYTITAWVNLGQQPSARMTIATKTNNAGDNAYLYTFQGDNRLAGSFYGDGTNSSRATSGTPFVGAGDVSAWLFLAVNVDISAGAAGISLYRGDSSFSTVSMTTADNNATSLYNSGGAFYIGADKVGASVAGFLNGILDEIKVSNTAVKTVGWLETEYNNQYSPATFYTVGSETEA